MHFLEIKQAPKIRGLVLKRVDRGFAIVPGSSLTVMRW